MLYRTGHFLVQQIIKRQVFHGVCLIVWPFLHCSKFSINVIKVFWYAKILVNHFLFHTKFPSAPWLYGEDIVSPAICSFSCHCGLLPLGFQDFRITFFQFFQLLFHFFLEYFIFCQLFQYCISFILKQIHETCIMFEQTSQQPCIIFMAHQVAHTACGDAVLHTSYWQNNTHTLFPPFAGFLQRFATNVYLLFIVCNLCFKVI